jgi:hypothetical protein
MGDAEPPTLSSSTEPRAWTSMGKRHRHISQRLNRHLSLYPFELYQWMRAIDHYRRNTATESTRPPPPVPDKVLLNLRNRLQQRRKKGQVHIIVDSGKYFIKGTYYTGVYHVSQSLCQSLRTIPSIHIFFRSLPSRHICNFHVSDYNSHTRRIYAWSSVGDPARGFDQVHDASHVHDSGVSASNPCASRYPTTPRITTISTLSTCRR